MSVTSFRDAFRNEVRISFSVRGSMAVSPSVWPASNVRANQSEREKRHPAADACDADGCTHQSSDDQSSDEQADSADAGRAAEAPGYLQAPGYQVERHG